MTTTKKLEPTLAIIPEIDPKKQTMKMVCTAKGEAIWARFELLYPVIITSRKWLGHLATGASQDVEIIAVKVGDKMLKALPSHVGPGDIDIIAKAKGSTGITITLTCRVEPQTAGEPADEVSVDAAVAELTASVPRRPEDPAPRPTPADPRADPFTTGRNIELEPAENPDLAGSDGPFGVVSPEVAKNATEELQNLLKAENMDDATRESIKNFVDSDGDPTETLKGAQ